MTARSDLPAWRYTGRSIVFILLLAFMMWGPFSRQILHSGNDLFRPWIMFKGKAVGVVDVQYFRQFPDGRRELLNRYEILGYDHWRRAPRSVRRLKGRGSAVELGYLLCKRLGHADVRVISRIATRKGWRDEEKGTRNICLAKRRLR